MKHLKFIFISTIIVIGFISCVSDDSDGISTDPLWEYEELNVTHEFTLYPNEGHG